MTCEIPTIASVQGWEESQGQLCHFPSAEICCDLSVGAVHLFSSVLIQIVRTCALWLPNENVGSSDRTVKEA